MAMDDGWQPLPAQGALALDSREKGDCRHEESSSRNDDGGDDDENDDDGDGK